MSTGYKAEIKFDGISYSYGDCARLGSIVLELLKANNIDNINVVKAEVNNGNIYFYMRDGRKVEGFTKMTCDAC